MLGGIAQSSVNAAQPSYDTLRVDGQPFALPYQVWVAWTPLVVPLSDGRAFAFFSAQTVNPDATVGTKKLYVSQFNPAAGTWAAATPLPGGQIQFGTTAVVDSAGTVHVVYTDRADDQTTTFGQIVYMKSTPEGGWTAAVPVAPEPTAGHQLSPELVLDRNGGLHVVWQDQRAVDQAARDALASNADIFSSDLGADGVWSAPVQVNTRPDPTTNASRPQLGTDGDRLIAVWSIYNAESGLDTAARLEWSSRPIDGSAGWSPAQVLLERGTTQIGGRLLDIATDPRGGAVLIFGSRTDTINTIYAQRLQPAAPTWDAPITLLTGDRGSFPSASIDSAGNVVVAYNIGSGQGVQVGAVVHTPGAPRGSVETVITAGEDGSQGRAMITFDLTGRLWVIYMHEPTGGIANEVRVIRGSTVFTDLAPDAPAATPVPAASPAA